MVRAAGLPGRRASRGADITTLTVGPTRQRVDLAIGPVRPLRFRASPGDVIELRGAFPIEHEARVRARAIGLDGRAVRLGSARVAGAVRVTLPSTLGPGRWQLELSARNMATTRVPIEMIVERW